jgi:hypothetical protein
MPANGKASCNLSIAKQLLPHYAPARTPALLQSDVWAAYDRLFAHEVQRREDQECKNEILSLFARFTKKLA